MESGRLCVAKWRAERYVSFERVWRRAERGGGLRERSRSYVLFEVHAGACCCVEESLRVRVMRIGEGVTSLERGEKWNGAGVVSVAFAKYKVLA